MRCTVGDKAADGLRRAWALPGDRAAVARRALHAHRLPVAVAGAVPGRRHARRPWRPRRPVPLGVLRHGGLGPHVCSVNPTVSLHWLMRITSMPYSLVARRPCLALPRPRLTHVSPYRFFRAGGPPTGPLPRTCTGGPGQPGASVCRVRCGGRAGPCGQARRRRRAVPAQAADRERGQHGQRGERDECRVSRVWLADTQRGVTGGGLPMASLAVWGLLVTSGPSVARFPPCCCSKRVPLALWMRSVSDVRMD